MAIKPLPNETDLLAKIAMGDQRAFNELFEGYFNVLGDYVFKITKSLEISEEIVQDTFVKVWLQRSTLLDIRNFSYYLFILCRNQTLDHLRKRAKDRVVIAELESFLKESGDTGQTENPAEAYRALIDDAVSKLPAQAKKVYMMSRYERLKHEEIAKKLEISPETVKKHIQYAITFIKKDVRNSMDLTIALVLLSPLIFS